MTAEEPRISKLVVIGVGLVGGSFALALKAAGRVHRVVGVGRGHANLELARSRGIVDAAIKVGEIPYGELPEPVGGGFDRFRSGGASC